MANVLNKKTKQYLRSVNTLDYLDGSWIINPDISSVVGVESKYWKVSGELVSKMSVDEIKLIDFLNLNNYKVSKMNQIDARTSQLISIGHKYGVGVFSLSREAQRTMLGMYLSRAQLTYPIVFNSLDNLSTVTLKTQQDVEMFYGNALVTKRTHLDSGTKIKDLVRAANSRSGIELIKDTR